MGAVELELATEKIKKLVGDVVDQGIEQWQPSLWMERLGRYRRARMGAKGD
jgi:hypothetical protein